MELHTLTVAEVLEVHNTLVRDFENSADPISPPGIRSVHLLESAVGRQHSGLGEVLKYPEPISNAATLLFGLCCDHPFHNGNKRTALVSMLVHMDRNKWCLFDTTQHDLYEFMIRVADHSIGIRRNRRVRSKPPQRRKTDDEVAAIEDWLRRRSGRVVRGERKITWRELRRILESFGYRLENPHDNKMDIVRDEVVTKGFFTKREVMIPKRIGTIGWPGDNRDIAINDLKKVREICRLREMDGVDSDSFYSYTVVIDSFVNRYRKVLRALAKV